MGGRMWAAHLGLARRRPPVPILTCMPSVGLQLRARQRELIRELARMPDVVARLQAEHVAGPDKRCRVCPSPVTIAPIWPCRLRLIADRAAEST